MNDPLLQSILNATSDPLTAPPSLDDMGLTDEALRRIYDWASGKANYGESAGYIPALKRVDPELKAIVAGDLLGNIRAWGTGLHTIVSAQSVIKPFLYIYALEQGLEPGSISSIEATALRFNNDMLMQPELGRMLPGHPLNNAGAISSAGAISRFSDFLDFMRMLTGTGNLNILEDIYRSEMETNFNNRALAYRMVAAGRFESREAGEKALDNYTLACSIGVTPEQALNAYLVLANHGILMGEQVIVRDNIVRAINAMNSYGLYEQTGEISLLAAGVRALSCKSGVSGLLVNVDPGRGAFCTYSPRLDKAGNSVFGKYALIPLNNLMATPNGMRLSAGEINRVIERNQASR